MQVPDDPPHSYGDCLRACVASIFELPSDAVPHFVEDGPGDGTGNPPWVERLRVWLEPMGFGALIMDVHSARAQPAGDALPFHYIRSGRHPSGRTHAAVFFAEQMVHNPTPGEGNPFIRDFYPQHYLFFVKR